MSSASDMYASLANQFSELSDQHAKLAVAYANCKRNNDSLRARLGESAYTDADFVNDNSNSLSHKKRRSNSSGSVDLNDLVIFQITFPYHVMRSMSELFAAMDTQKQGFITEASFTTGRYQDYFQSFGTWTQLKQYFDQDGNNAIDSDEFVRGFALMALNEVINVGIQITVSNFETEMQRVVVQYAENKIQACSALVQDHLGASNLSLQRNMSASQMPSNLVYVATISNAVVLDMSNTFKALLGTHVGGVGQVNADTIRSAGLSSAKWSHLLNMFDEDKSGTIDEKEFLNGFKNWVLSQPIDIPSGQGSMKQVMDLVLNTANTKLSTAISEFKVNLASP